VFERSRFPSLFSLERRSNSTLPSRRNFKSDVSRRLHEEAAVNHPLSASSCAVQQRNSIERKNFAKITLMKRNSKSRRQLASVLHAGLFRIIENNVNLVFDVKKRRDPTVTVYYPELRLLTNTRVCTKNFNRNSLEWKYW